MRNNDIESSLKRFLKRKVKITLGVVVAFLITGTVGYGGDIVAKGVTKEYTITEQDGKPKIIGGWNYTKDSADKNADHSNSTTSITLTSGTFDELIGGNHLKNTGSTDTYISKIGNTSVTMNGGTVQYLIGGSKSNGTKADITNGKTKVIVNGGTIGQSDSNGVIKAGLIGGNYIKSTSGQGTLITAKTDETDVEITGGTFANKVIGGSFVDTYGTNTVKGLTVEDKETNLKISGGTFNNFVIGGGAAAGTGNTSTVGTSNLTIKGGIFNSNIYAGGAALEGVKGKNDIGTVRVSNSNLTIDGTDVVKGNLKFSGAIYAGGLDSGISGKITLTLKNLTQDMFGVKGGIYGGSKGSTEGALVEDGDIEINISNSHIYADILGGGGAFGKSSKVKAKNTKITVSNTSISGYENNGNTWTGRIFGAGMAQGGALFEQESTDVVINNVDGVTYDQNNGEVSNKVGVRIYGGGQNYKAGVDSQLKIGSTKVTIGGNKTALAEVYGGSIISGTGNKGTVSVGKTEVIINDGKIVDYVVGGNNTNWNGYSVVGIEDNNGKEYKNGQKYADGSTKITINGGDMSTAEIIGGSYVDYGLYYEDNVIHDGIVYGTTNIDIKGGKIGLVVGGGKALYSNPVPRGNGEVYPSTSNVEGTTNINITGGSLSGNIIGGGYAFSNQSSVESIANVKGTTNINISGGTIEKNIYGGGFADGKSAAANVEGDTNITISGGDIGGNIYAGGLVDVENGGTANVNGDTNITISGGDIEGNIYAGGLAENGGTANVTGNSTVTFLNGSTFANSVYGTSEVNSALANNDASKKSTLAFGNDKEKFEGEFKGKFSNFNILRTGKGSVVGIGELNSNNINRDIEITGSGRIKTKINEIGGNIKLTGGTLEIYTEDKENKEDKINFGDKKLTLSDKGILETKSGNIFANALNPDGKTKDSGEVGTGNSIEYNGGSVALNDKKYNLDYLTSAIAAMKKKSGSKTSILMLGTLVNADGEKQDEIDIDTAAGIGDKALLDNVTVNVGEKNTSLVIGDTSGAGDTGTVSTNNNLNASTLNFDASGTEEEGEKTISIKKESKLVLGGTKDGELVTVGGKAEADKVKINVEAGTLVLGSNFSSGANQTLSASVIVGGAEAGAGKLEVNAGNQTVTGTIENKESGTVAVSKDAALNAKEIKNEGALNVAGNAEIKTLTGGENSIITVGDNGSAGKLVVETLQLNGGKMFLDPVWKEGEVNTIGNASKGAVIFDGTNGIDGQIAVGQNSVLVVGDKATDWAEKAFENSGLKWKDDITAALAIRGNQTLGTLGIVATNDGSQGSKTSGGSINVNGSLTGHSNENYKGTGYLNFADNSLLIVDTGSLNGKAAISGVKSLSVANTSKLYLENMTAGTHTILTGEGIDYKGWNDSNILNGDRMLAVTGNKEGNKFTVTAAVQKAEDVLQGVVVPNMINNIWRRELNTIRTNEGIKFLSKAIDKGYIADTKESVRTINEAVQIAGVAGVHRTGLDTIKRTSDTAVRQLSMVNKDAAKEGLWAEMSYGSTDVSGVKIGNTDTGYNGRYEGISVGSNFKTWESGVLGGAFHYVSGENKSDEGVSRTKNEYEYFGLSLYNNLRVGNINIIGDLGYSRGDNEIKQYTKIERLKADIDTELMTAGIKGEYLIQQDNFNIVPYVGLRYVRLNVDSFDTKNDTGKLFHTEKEDADLFLVPVGVNISTQVINQSGWTVKPKLDLAYIGALGDKKSETKVGLAEYSAIDEIKVNMADSSAYSGSIGVEFKKDNKAFEVGYSLYSSKHETENRGTMSFKYNF
ncbi:autotransporter domain-containing protein [Fusobacterium varium]|uniref:Autotransporter domain-containing protein n=1 Tax=Fusobacterium varium ATCC 27725 TaxID=469618 RepID=A0ABN5JHN6_FUSVA|nr:autotransporter domain-containing protein [Fusobacterium varium]AVQ30399.1 autotransporter domain-containing protein [Fusobacterium varium ATCC 27725]EES64563.1 outer membrane autotransporter barrel domain protein [Fusobacterium varium ATCC 27725]